MKNTLLVIIFLANFNATIFSQSVDITPEEEVKIYAALKKQAKHYYNSMLSFNYKEPIDLLKKIDNYNKIKKILASTSGKMKLYNDIEYKNIRNFYNVFEYFTMLNNSEFIEIGYRPNFMISEIHKFNDDLFIENIDVVYNNINKGNKNNFLYVNTVFTRSFKRIPLQSKEKIIRDGEFIVVCWQFNPRRDKGKLLVNENDFKIIGTIPFDTYSRENKHHPPKFIREIPLPKKPARNPGSKELLPIEEMPIVNDSISQFLNRYRYDLKISIDKKNHLQNMINKYFYEMATIQPDFSVDEINTHLSPQEYLQQYFSLNIDAKFEQFNLEKLEKLNKNNYSIVAKFSIVNTIIANPLLIVKGDIKMTIQFNKVENNKFSDFKIKKIEFENKPIPMEELKQLSDLKIVGYFKKASEEGMVVDDQITIKLECMYDARNMDLEDRIPGILKGILEGNPRNTKATIRIRKEDVFIHVHRSIAMFKLKIDVLIDKDSIYLVRKFPFSKMNKSCFSMHISDFVMNNNLPLINLSDIQTAFIGSPFLKEDSMRITIKDSTRYSLKNNYKTAQTEYLIKKDYFVLDEMSLSYKSDSLDSKLIFNQYFQIDAKRRLPNSIEFELNGKSTTIPKRVFVKKADLVNTMNNAKLGKNEGTIPKNFNRVSWDDFIGIW